MREKVVFTLKDVNDWIYSFQRHASAYSNLEAKEIAQDVADALEAFYNWNIKHGCPITAEFVATDRYII